MTFPLISGGLIRRWPDRPGETLATLYFTNSLGAAVGVLVSGFVLIRRGRPAGHHPRRGTAQRGAGRGRLVRGSRLRRNPAPDGRRRRAAASNGLCRRRWLTLAAFLTGAASFMYELGWIRMLSLVLGSSTHSFELMLSAFILGLALGGLYVRRRIERIDDPRRYLAGVMVPWQRWLRSRCRPTA